MSCIPGKLHFYYKFIANSVQFNRFNSDQRIQYRMKKIVRLNIVIE